MSSLKLAGVNKVYPSGETALYDINIEAEDKEFLVIVGADGSGKSSFLRVIAGLEDVSSGKVYIDGKDVTEEEPKNRDIAMVFQSSTLYPSLNVFDNMAFGMRLRKAPEALVQERVKAVANILGLNEVLYRKPKVLTAAAKQRVAIGRAIAREPKLFLFDEPFSGLDEKLRADMLNIIINLQARMQGTFVYSTKSVAEALTIGTRLVILKDGFVQQADTPANLYDYPANTYVAFYIGSPTINFLKKAVITEEDGKYFANVCGAKCELPENIVSRFTEIKEYAASGKYVTLGIRPEDAKICAGGALKAKTGKAENGYAECTLEDGTAFVVTTEATEEKKDAQISFDPARLYVFDGATCLTLLSRDGGYKQTGLPDSDFVPLAYDEERSIHESLKPKKHGKKK